MRDVTAFWIGRSRRSSRDRRSAASTGGIAVAGSLVMATGPIAGGLIYDNFTSYAWLYIGAWGMGIAAFLRALSSRPFAKMGAVPVLT
jgi:MFS family permease